MPELEHDPQQRVVLVTGSGSAGGLGNALAIDLAASGFAVMVHFRSSGENAERTVQKIAASGGRVKAVGGDLSNQNGANAVADAVGEQFGRLDVLVNNAGVYVASDLNSITGEEWIQGLSSTASATFFTTRACLPMLRESPRGGRIINIGDGSCDQPGARDMAMAYHIGKTGVWMLTRSFAKQEAVNGVAVNMVSPGLLENSVGLLDDAEADGIPAGSYGKFSDVAEAVRLIANAEVTYLTGSNLAVGGGWNL